MKIHSTSKNIIKMSINTIHVSDYNTVETTYEPLTPHNVRVLVGDYYIMVPVKFYKRNIFLERIQPIRPNRNIPSEDEED